LWEVLGAARRRGRGAPLRLHAPEVELRFAPLDQFAAIAWDYAAAEHSTRGHPLEPLRGRLTACSLPAASEVIAMPNGSEVSYAGLVICRQRPGTAAGVVFMTLEDETGFVNLVVWSKVFRQYRPTILTTSFLGVSGTIQSQQHVVHIIAQRFWLPDLPAAPDDHRDGAPQPGTRSTLSIRSHDFH
ncbi:MAG: OB-fold nucleic acid binding domain-containing protein, partial [Spirochaetaceae bacterium]|nr:OB-fold nucleic acid binding domain-containing protein [Spirochaetaceae bacterium]